MIDNIENEVESIHLQECSLEKVSFRNYLFHNKHHVFNVTVFI